MYTLKYRKSADGMVEYFNFEAPTLKEAFNQALRLVKALRGIFVGVTAD